MVLKKRNVLDIKYLLDVSISSISSAILPKRRNYARRCELDQINGTNRNGRGERTRRESSRERKRTIITAYPAASSARNLVKSPFSNILAGSRHRHYRLQGRFHRVLCARPEMPYDPLKAGGLLTIHPEGVNRRYSLGNFATFAPPATR